MSCCSSSKRNGLQRCCCGPPQTTVNRKICLLGTVQRSSNSMKQPSCCCSPSQQSRNSNQLICQSCSPCCCSMTYSPPSPCCPNQSAEENKACEVLLCCECTNGIGAASKPKLWKLNLSCELSDPADPNAACRPVVDFEPVEDETPKTRCKMLICCDEPQNSNGQCMCSAPLPVEPSNNCCCCCKNSNNTSNNSMMMRCQPQGCCKANSGSGCCSGSGCPWSRS